MRYLWCVNELPNYDKGDKAQIDGYFLGAFDPVCTSQALNDIRNRNKARGVYMASNWPQFAGKTGKQMAQTMSARYQQLLVPGLRVQFDIEQHDPALIVECLTTFRTLHPTAAVSLTVEGMQGGWLRGIADTLMKLKVRVVPQAYWGAAGTMQGDWAADQILLDLILPGSPGGPCFAPSSVSLFYDADHLPRGWQGYAFTQARLPA